MIWSDTYASWCWCYKLSQQIGRYKFPPPASNRKLPVGSTARKLLLGHREPTREKKKVFVSFSYCFQKRICSAPKMQINHKSINTTLTVFSVAFMPARKTICPTPRDKERLSRIWVRGCHTSLVKKASNKKTDKQKKKSKKSKQDRNKNKTKQYFTRYFINFVLYYFTHPTGFRS